MRGPALPLLVILVLAGCSGSDDGASSTMPTGPASTMTAATSQASTLPSPPPPPAATPPAPTSVDVEIQGNAFHNATVTIQVGGTVHWTHKDGTAAHSVKADDVSFDSNGGLPCPGPGCMTSVAHSTYEHKFDAAGSFAYHCEVHSSMKGTVVVVAA